MPQPEHLLQIAVTVMAPRVIVVPHRLRCFDRSRNASGIQHLMESQRGIRSGTPDTELVWSGRSCNIELKRPATRHLAQYQPSEAQEREMQALRDAGAYAGCAWSLLDVVAHWRAAGVPLAAMADLYAEEADAKLLARLYPDRLKKVAKKPRQPKTPVARIRRAEAMRDPRRGGVLF